MTHSTPLIQTPGTSHIEDGQCRICEGQCCEVIACERAEGEKPPLWVRVILALGRVPMPM